MKTTTELTPPVRRQVEKLISAKIDGAKKDLSNNEWDLKRKVEADVEKNPPAEVKKLLAQAQTHKTAISKIRTKAKRFGYGFNDYSSKLTLDASSDHPRLRGFSERIGRKTIQLEELKSDTIISLLTPDTSYKQVLANLASEIAKITKF